MKRRPLRSRRKWDSVKRRTKLWCFLPCSRQHFVEAQWRPQFFLADGGGDDNLLPGALLQRITKVDITVSTITFTSPETFRQTGPGTQPLV